jgi:hypothetical protein
MDVRLLGIVFCHRIHPVLIWGIDTTEEIDKFFTDAKRLADDVSQNQTFFTVRPLLNFWGAFTPSEEVSRVNLFLLLTDAQRIYRVASVLMVSRKSIVSRFGVATMNKAVD